MNEKQLDQKDINLEEREAVNNVLLEKCEIMKEIADDRLVSMFNFNRVNYSELLNNKFEKCPINKILPIDFYDGQYINIEGSCESVVSKFLNEYMNGSKELNEIYTHCITLALDRFLVDQTLGEQQYKKVYYYPERDAFIRLDIYCTKLVYLEKAEAGKINNAVAYVVVKSAVKTTSLANYDAKGFVVHTLFTEETYRPSKKVIIEAAIDSAWDSINTYDEFTFR
ncbi:MAG: hypothetical protein RR863_04160 [Erysipelotrichaceae bacterium]